MTPGPYDQYDNTQLLERREEIKIKFGDLWLVEYESAHLEPTKDISNLSKMVKELAIKLDKLDIEVFRRGIYNDIMQEERDRVAQLALAHLKKENAEPFQSNYRIFVS